METEKEKNKEEISHANVYAVRMISLATKWRQNRRYQTHRYQSINLGTRRINQVQTEIRRPKNLPKYIITQYYLLTYRKSIEFQTTDNRYDEIFINIGKKLLQNNEISTNEESENHIQSEGKKNRSRDYKNQ